MLRFRSQWEAIGGDKVAPYLAVWLETGGKEYFKREGGLFVKGEVWREYIGEGKPGSASWMKFLSQIAWVPSKSDDKLRLPANVRIETNLKEFKLSLTY